MSDAQKQSHTKLHPPVMSEQSRDSDSLRQRPIRSFALRGGHMSEAQKRAYDNGMPKWSIPFSTTPLDWHRLKENFERVVLEIGFGMGETTASIAKQAPNTLFVGCEVYTSGVGALMKRIEEQDLHNIRVLQHDAVEVLKHMILPERIDGMHIFFPDPWHKSRHHKRRLIQSSFVQLAANRLAPGGYLHCATDWQNYAEQMLSVLNEESSLTNTATDYAPRPSYRPVTKFETRGLRLGHGVWDLVFKKRT